MQVNEVRTFTGLNVRLEREAASQIGYDRNCTPPSGLSMFPFEKYSSIQTLRRSHPYFRLSISYLLAQDVVPDMNNDSLMGCEDSHTGEPSHPNSAEILVICMTRNSSIIRVPQYQRACRISDVPGVKPLPLASSRCRETTASKLTKAIPDRNLACYHSLRPDSCCYSKNSSGSTGRDS